MTRKRPKILLNATQTSNASDNQIDDRSDVIDDDSEDEEEIQRAKDVPNVYVTRVMKSAVLPKMAKRKNQTGCIIVVVT